MTRGKSKHHKRSAPRISEPSTNTAQTSPKETASSTERVSSKPSAADNRSKRGLPRKAISYIGQTGRKGAIFAIGTLVTAIITWAWATYHGEITNAFLPHKVLDVAVAKLPNQGIPASSIIITSTTPSIDSPPQHSRSSTALESAPVIPSEYAFPEKLTTSQVAQLNSIQAGRPIGQTAPDGESIHWMRSHGGADVNATYIRVILQGIDQPVRVLAIRAKVVQRSAVPAGTLLYVPPQGGEEDIHANLNLDQPNPMSTYFDSNTISILPDESVAVDVTAATHKYDVTWDLAIDYIAEGTQQTEIVRDQNGDDFRTTGMPSGSTGAHDFNLYADVWWFDTGNMSAPAKFRPGAPPS